MTHNPQLSDDLLLGNLLKILLLLGLRSMPPKQQWRRKHDGYVGQGSFNLQVSPWRTEAWSNSLAEW